MERTPRHRSPGDVSALSETGTAACSQRPHHPDTPGQSADGLRAQECAHEQQRSIVAIKISQTRRLAEGGGAPARPRAYMYLGTAFARL